MGQRGSCGPGKMVWQVCFFKSNVLHHMKQSQSCPLAGSCCNVPCLDGSRVRAEHTRLPVPGHPHLGWDVGALGHGDLKRGPCWVLEHGHSPCPSILPVRVWPKPWAGTRLAVQTHILCSLGSSLLGSCLPQFLLECVPCGGGYHDRDAAPGLVPLRWYAVSWGGDTSLQKHTHKSKPLHWIFTYMVSPHWVTNWENPRAEKTCQYANLIGLDRVCFCTGSGFPPPAGTVTGHSWRSAAKAWLVPCLLLLDNVSPQETPWGLALLWVGWWTRCSPEVPSNSNWFLAGRRHVGNRGQSSWVLMAHFLSE